MLTRLQRAGVLTKEAVAGLFATPVRWIPFSREQALASGAMARERALAAFSLGDRACLALARERNVPAITADRAWLRLPLSVEVELLR